MANNRVKSDRPVLIEIRDWKHADELVRKIGEQQLEIQRTEGLAKEAIDKAKSELAESVKRPQEKTRLYCRSLEAFSTSNRGIFGKQRSLKLNFGVLGWRKSTSISIKKTTLGLIKQVFSAAKAKTLAHIKETVDKEALAKLTDEQLASVDARRKVKDDFFVEPSTPKAADHTNK